MNEITIENIMEQEAGTCMYLIPVDEKTEEIFAEKERNPENRMTECAGETINIANIKIRVVEYTDLDGSEVRYPKITILTKQGESYQTSAKGVFNSVKYISRYYMNKLTSGKLYAKINYGEWNGNKYLSLAIGK